MWPNQFSGTALRGAKGVAKPMFAAPAWPKEPARLACFWRASRVTRGSCSMRSGRGGWTVRHMQHQRRPRGVDDQKKKPGCEGSRSRAIRGLAP
jgi:hypothetical protein